MRRIGLFIGVLLCGWSATAAAQSHRVSLSVGRRAQSASDRVARLADRQILTVPGGARYGVEIVGRQVLKKNEESRKPVAVVLCDGPGLRPEYLTPILNRMAPDLQVVLITPKGVAPTWSTGEPVTAPTVASYRLDSLVADLAALADQLAMGEHGMRLVGCGYGGLVAARYAALHPVDKLVLVSPWPATGAGWQQALIARKARFKVQPTANLALTDSLRDGLAVDLFNPMLATRLTARTGESAVARTMATALGADYDLRPSLPKITAPPLLITVMSDWIGESSVAAYAAALTTVRRLDVPMAGHCPLEERPEIVLPQLRNFFEIDGIQTQKVE